MDGLELRYFCEVGCVKDTYKSEDLMTSQSAEPYGMINSIMIYDSDYNIVWNKY